MQKKKEIFAPSRRPVFYTLTGVLNFVLVLIGLPHLFQFQLYRDAGLAGFWCLYCVVFLAVCAQAFTDRFSYSGKMKLREVRIISVNSCIGILLGILLTRVGVTEMQSENVLSRYLQICGVYLIARWIVLWTSGNWGTLENSRNTN